ncbi:hypothetical protein GVAV_003313 [Gurleya vavrai]
MHEYNLICLKTKKNENQNFRDYLKKKSNDHSDSSMPTEIDSVYIEKKQKIHIYKQHDLLSEFPIILLKNFNDPKNLFEKQMFEMYFFDQNDKINNKKTILNKKNILRRGIDINKPKLFLIQIKPSFSKCDEFDKIMNEFKSILVETECFLIKNHVKSLKKNFAYKIEENKINLILSILENIQKLNQNYNSVLKNNNEFFAAVLNDISKHNTKVKSNFEIQNFFSIKIMNIIKGLLGSDFSEIIFLITKAYNYIYEINSHLSSNIKEFSAENFKVNDDDSDLSSDYSDSESFIDESKLFQDNAMQDFSKTERRESRLAHNYFKDYIDLNEDHKSFSMLFYKQEEIYIIYNKFLKVLCSFIVYFNSILDETAKNKLNCKFLKINFPIKKYNSSTDIMNLLTELSENQNLQELKSLINIIKRINWCFYFYYDHNKFCKLDEIEVFASSSKFLQFMGIVNKNNVVNYKVMNYHKIIDFSKFTKFSKIISFCFNAFFKIFNNDNFIFEIKKRFHTNHEKKEICIAEEDEEIEKIETIDELIYRCNRENYKPKTSSKPKQKNKYFVIQIFDKIYILIL